MRKDLKIGMCIGVVLVIGATIVISLMPGSTVEKRLLETAPVDIQPAEGDQQQPPLITSPEPGDTPAVTPKQTESEKPKPSPPTERIHIVIEGQTLSAIAMKYYNDPSQWKKIYQANIRIDPRKLRPGTKLIIPE